MVPLPEPPAPPPKAPPLEWSDTPRSVAHVLTLGAVESPYKKKGLGHTAGDALAENAGTTSRVSPSILDEAKDRMKMDGKDVGEQMEEERQLIEEAKSKKKKKGDDRG